ncbi:SlyX [Vibrio anguillarum 775]|nr:SlyX [Vibrio anguillarum 775]AGU58659.1 lysis protein [Vibrio anguillarum M3]
METRRLVMNDKYIQQLEQRVSDLECQLAFQEQTIDELNQALSTQQLMLTKMQDQMKYVAGKVKNMDASHLADPSEETPPPHY